VRGAAGAEFGRLSRFAVEEAIVDCEAIVLDRRCCGNDLFCDHSYMELANKPKGVVRNVIPAAVFGSA